MNGYSAMNCETSLFPRSSLRRSLNNKRRGMVIAEFKCDDEIDRAYN